jgi:putative PIN family toxin of toxin-antitoxin system
VAAPRRIVVDPGVLVSALISRRGPTALVLDLVEVGAVVAVVSPALLDELGRVLRREKFRPYLTLAEADRFVKHVGALGDLVDDPANVATVSRDPKDDYLIALARLADADALVSGDDDIASLTLDDLTVFTPRAFVDELTR